MDPRLSYNFDEIEASVRQEIHTASARFNAALQELRRRSRPARTVDPRSCDRLPVEQVKWHQAATALNEILVDLGNAVRDGADDVAAADHRPPGSGPGLDADPTKTLRGSVGKEKPAEPRSSPSPDLSGVVMAPPRHVRCGPVDFASAGRRCAERRRRRLRVVLLGTVQKLVEPRPGRGDRRDDQSGADQHYRVDKGQQHDHDDEAPEELSTLAPEFVDDRPVSLLRSGFVLFRHLDLLRIKVTAILLPYAAPIWICIARDKFRILASEASGVSTSGRVLTCADIRR